MNGIFCISLDFEKYWGVHDVSNWQDQEMRMRQVEQVVLRLLKSFEWNQIQCSWATVGLLGLKDLNSIENQLNQLNVSYDNPVFYPGYHLAQLKNIPLDILTGHTEINAIINTEGQELASHTYTHYYSLEKGQTNADFLNDLNAMTAFGESLDHSFKSIIFPRNQVNPAHLKICAEHGYLAYRGNQNSPYWSNSDFGSESKTKKAKRYLDAYFDFGSTLPTKVQDLKADPLINIPATRFLRPSSGKNILEKKKIKVIKKEMEHAAKNGHVYHLWWHPHNFAENTNEHFDQLNAILNHFQDLKNRFGMESLNMSAIAAKISS